MEQLKQQLQAAGILYKENEPLSAHCTFYCICKYFTIFAEFSL